MNNIDLTSPPAQIENILKSLDWLLEGESVTEISSPGAGNMNVVLRITSNQRTFILKQSRPFVQKYPDLAAPLDRIDTENTFYQSVAESEASEFFPTILAYSSDEHLMMMQDIGDSIDMTALYADRSIDDATIEHLLEALSEIHNSEFESSFPSNMELRQLNHQHIFVLPFLEDNGFQLDEVQVGLQALSLPYKRDQELKVIIEELGAKYLSLGDTLLHGDYYPGSWMRGKDQIFVIDPEFSFIGFAEFDLGVMAAHLTMVTGDNSYVSMICAGYDGPANFQLVTRIAGIEIMRRIIGLAQLPFERTLEEKDELLKMAREMIL